MTDPTPRISLAQWSLHRSIETGEVRGLDFPRLAAERFGIRAVELVNTLLERSDDRALESLRRQADDCGVSVHLIMVDDEGDLAAEDPSARRRAVDRHRRWLDEAALLGCRALRVNTGGGPEVEGERPLSDPRVAATLERVAASCSALCDAAASSGIDVLIENHGGLSSNIEAVVELQYLVGRENFGTLPDFGNFPPGADRYGAIEKLMPYARAVSAKCYDFDDEGNEKTMDYPRLLEIVRSAGYEGYLGIEYEGERLPESEGILACRRLLERLLAP